MIAAGHVYYLHIDCIDPPKSKFVVLAYVADDGRLRFFAINSERTEFQKTRDEVRKHILPLNPDNHRFLKHASWLCCHELIGGYTATTLEDEIFSDPSRHLGLLNHETFQVVKAAVEASRLLSERDKKQILAQWL